MNIRISLDQYRSRVLILAALFLITSVNCSALRAAVRSDREAEGFLEKYGYLHEDHSHNAVAIQSAVREFQWLTHLPVTGRLDGATLRQMGAPRCGVKDDGSHQVWAQRVNGIFTGSGAPSKSALRRKRYAAPGEKWYKHHLTYRVVNWPQQLAPGLVRLAVHAAFQLWSDVSGLVFQEAMQGPSDIRLAFYSGEHNDGTSNAFDGPGGALAHAFFPRRGEAHFDKAERWTLNSHKGHNLFMVMAHEIGHTLGLEHSPVRHALMSPYYRKLGRGLVLSWDDITAVQQLYGKPLQGPAVRLPSRALSSALQKWEQAEVEAAAGSALPLYCQGGFDAVTTDQNGTVFIFRGNLFWKVSPEGDAGTPLPLQQHWPLLPLTIEAAAFSPLDNKWYFFKGKRVWCYSTLGLEAGFPKKTSKLGLPHHPDSAFYYAPLGHLVLFKGSRYSVLNLGQLYLEPYYPRRLDDWTGVPQDTNGGLTRSDGRLYLFRERQYWRFDPVKVRVTKKGQWGQDLPWMGCRGNPPQGNDIL